MDAELKAKWVAALRSGAYEQGTRQLVSLNGQRYCCLGVLLDACRFAVPAAFDGESVEKAYAQTRRLHGITNTTFFQMNDEERVSFAEIANYIETNL